MKKIICIAGFGDDASMFADLVADGNSDAIRFLPIDLPGFGAPPFHDRPATLDALADILADHARRLNADTVLAHSVASIIASLAAGKPDSPIANILSLEGNLIPADAYFSGKAAQFDSADSFADTFLPRLRERGADDPVLARYAEVVARADRTALWEFGCDAHSYSSQHVPGITLQKAANVVYLYNPENISAASLDWLNTSALPQIILPGASHWASVDQPEMLAAKIREAIDLLH